MSKIWEVIQGNIGFSWRGLVIVILAMLPNMLFGVLSKNNMPKSQVEPDRILSFIESAARILFIIFLVGIVNKQERNTNQLIIGGMVVCIIIYYYLWSRYFLNGRDVAYLGKNLWIIPIPMAIFPCLYFLFAAIWLNNIPAIIGITVFMVAHCINSYVVLR